LGRYIGRYIFPNNGLVVFKMNDCRYEGIPLQSFITPEYKRDLIKWATVMPIEDDREIPDDEEMINIEPKNVIEHANRIHHETRYYKINNWNNKGMQ
jgi:hypothetical protein